MEPAEGTGFEQVCRDLEDVSDRLQEEYKTSRNVSARKLPDLIRRIEALQAASERVRCKSELLLARRQTAVLQTIAGLLENAQRLKCADMSLDSTDIDTASGALVESVKACSFLQGSERDAAIGMSRAAAVLPPAVTRPQLHVAPLGHDNTCPDGLSEGNQLYAQFEALPKHIKGHIKFSDVEGVLGKITAAIDELVDGKCHASRATRREGKTAVSRYTVKLPMRDLGKLCGQKASGKSGQAILLILRSLDVIKMDRESLLLLDRSGARHGGLQTAPRLIAAVRAAH